MKKVLLPFSFFVFTPIFILSCVLYLSYVSFKSTSNPLSFAPKSAVAYAALPTLDNKLSAEIVQEDSRVEMVRQFFVKYGSPLETYAQLVVDQADKHDLDFRLIPAIAMQESNLCLKAPKGTNNCWGYGIYKGSRLGFEDYGEGIEVVSKGLANYKENDLESPQEIMTKYTPHSDGSWAQGVEHFMAELK